MKNSTHHLYFTLGAYFDTGVLKYLFFVVVMFLYILIVFANVSLIVIICMNKSLHKPMYLFLCSLFVNELFGSTAMIPFLLVQILSDLHTISASLCFLQDFFLFLYGAVEYVNLAIMSYDRYIAICYPLQYNTRMTFSKSAIVIAVTWFYPLLICVVMVSLSTSLQLCGSIIEKLYCDNYSIVKLACSDTTIYNIYGLFISSLSIFCPLILIFYTYIRIIKICFSGSKHTRQKAFSTCTPHLVSLLNFSCGACFEILQTRFNMKNLPNILRILVSLYWLTCQPLLTPLIYGLNLSRIRIICKTLFVAEM